MRNLLLLLTATLLIFGSCKDDKQKIWDPNAMVLIKPDKSAFAPKSKMIDDNTPQHLSALEIVKQGTSLHYINWYDGNGTNKLEQGERATYGFADVQKDFNIPALKMWGVHIINQDGRFIKNFIYAEDVVVCKDTTIKIDSYHRIRIIDTIAYVPNSVLINAQQPIETAYDEGRYEDVYKMFDEAYTFRPITGAEWRELKAQGKQ